MRKLTENEKEYIKRIVEEASNNERYLIINSLDWLLQGGGNSVGINFKDQQLVVYKLNGKPAFLFKEEKGEMIVDDFLSHHEILDLESQIIAKTILIKQLEEDHLIYFIDDSDGYFSKEIDGIYIKKENSPNISKKLDNTISDMLKKSASQAVICMPDLIMLVKNDFMSEDERRHQEEISVMREQMSETRIQHRETIAKMSEDIEESNRRHKETLENKDEEVKQANINARKSRKVAIWVAIGSGVVSLLGSAAISSLIRTKIDKKQFDSIIQPLDTIQLSTIDIPSISKDLKQFESIILDSIYQPIESIQSSTVEMTSIVKELKQLESRKRTVADPVLGVREE